MSFLNTHEWFTKTEMKIPFTQKTLHAQNVNYIFSALAFFLVLIITKPYGLGLNSDSISYLVAGDNFSKGHGLYVFDSIYHRWPPLFPILIGFLQKINIDILTSLRCFYSLAYAFTIIFSGNILKQYIKSFLLFSFAMATLVLSAPLILGFSNVLSEGLFTFTVIIGYYFLHRYLHTQSYKHLILLSFSIGLSAITRYVGVLFILSTIIVLLFFTDKARQKKIGLFLLISCLPLFVWIVRNILYVGTYTGSRGGIIPSYAVDTPYLWGYLNTIASWFLHPRIPLHFRILIILIVVFLLFYSILNARKLRTVPNNEFNFLIALFIGIVIYNVGTYIILYYYNIFPYYRFFSPIIPLLYLLIFISFHHLKQLGFKQHYIKIVIMFILIPWWLYSMYATLWHITKVKDDGLGEFTRKSVVESQLLNWINNNKLEFKKLDFTVYSNYKDAIYIHTKVIAKGIPNKGQDVRNFFLNNEESYAILIWFHEDKLRENVIKRNINTYSLEELTNKINFTEIINLNDGSVYLIQLKD